MDPAGAIPGDGRRSRLLVAASHFAVVVIFQPHVYGDRLIMPMYMLARAVRGCSAHRRDAHGDQVRSRASRGGVLDAAPAGDDWSRCWAAARSGSDGAGRGGPGGRRMPCRTARTAWRSRRGVRDLRDRARGMARPGAGGGSGASLPNGVAVPRDRARVGRHARKPCGKRRGRCSGSSRRPPRDRCSVARGADVAPAFATCGRAGGGSRGAARSCRRERCARHVCSRMSRAPR